MFSLSRISIDMSNDDHWHRRTVPVSTRLIYRSTAARRLLSLLCDCLLAPDAYVATVSPLLSLLSVCPTIALRRQTSFTSPPPPLCGNGVVVKLSRARGTLVAIAASVLVAL